MHAAIISRPPDGGRTIFKGKELPQLKYYDEGVGTRWSDRIRGGGMGWGLSENIREAYAWLIENFEDDDEIFLFGFSRGAFTARSLGGLIGRCGIPRPPAAGGREALKDLTQRALAMYQGSKKPTDESRQFLANESRATRIKFIGVWDTVGALGVPLLNLNIAEKFHSTALGSHVDNAFHALAVDEHRKDYQAALWTENPGNAQMEQRWFPGAHANIGGGYEDDLLPDLALAWMAERARDCGLSLNPEVMRLDGNEYRAPVRDSFKEFMAGAYRFLRLGSRHFRPIGRGLNETVDDSVFRKWAAEPEYRPENVAHAGQAPAVT
jgi:uncharacterized protein (DUF2235 family)